MAGSPSQRGSSRPSYMTALGIDSPLQQRHACTHAVNWCCICRLPGIRWISLQK